MITSEGEYEETGVDRVMTISLLSSESESEEEMEESSYMNMIILSTSVHEHDNTKYILYSTSQYKYFK